MKKLLLAPALLLGLISFSQTYQPNWESLDKRPVPQWFKDAKFGIFIHWGVYAVPGYGKKGTYSEWYQNALQDTNSSTYKFHKEKFGNRSYYDLANDFKAELYNPDEWASLFEKSGAKYIVLTSKHHDGYTLWPSKESDRDWGFKWNAVDVGPKRDLLGDLFKAVKKTSVHAGMYYSLYEWYNPLWKADPKKFATEHTWPQMKELINTYQPEVFWTDGDWDMPAEAWKSKEFLTWMYNESPVKDKIVTYDRWGSGVRFKHGNIYTPEYQPDLDFEDHYWEESRGMGHSYGYNRVEDSWDYNSTQSLVLQLIDKVSRGGNFLLDIGPDEHGKIPPIMQERLLEIGEWLRINGEAIYNTVRWKTPSQWSEGRTDYKPTSGSGDLLLKLTVDPDPGYAVKEIFYTYNPTANALYAISPRYPDNGKIILRNIQLPATAAVAFLSGGESLSWKQEGDNVVITMPPYNPNKIKAPYAYAVKISNYGKFTAKPQMSVTYKNGSLTPLVGLSATGGEEIRYTTDGAEPVSTSPLYTQPFTIQKTAVVKAKSFLPGALPSGTVVEKVTKYEFMNAAKVSNPQAGISYRYYEPSGKIDLSVIDNTQPVKSSVTNTISEKLKQRTDKFCLAFEGYIKVTKDGVYDFSLISDDGSKLWIDDIETIDNDGEHGPVEKTGIAALKKGLHKIKLLYFDSSGGNTLQLKMGKQGEEKKQVDAGLLFH